MERFNILPKGDGEVRRSALARKTPLRTKSYMKRRRSKRARAKEFSPAVRRAVMERSSGCELYNMRPIAHLHHAVYRSQGGSSDLSNALGVCIPCQNACHSTRAMREFGEVVASEQAVSSYPSIREG